ncbi:hypothetical protein FERRO_00800 [Ferrovum sp. JA12]|nr:hypothetical protein FERRO_00800 [Ferrovum sp. JA12]
MTDSRGWLSPTAVVQTKKDTRRFELTKCKAGVSPGSTWAGNYSTSARFGSSRFSRVNFSARVLTTSGMTKTFCGSTRRSEISARNLHAFFGQHILLLKGVKELGFYANQRLNGGHSTAMSHHGNPAPESKATG